MINKQTSSSPERTPLQKAHAIAMDRRTAMVGLTALMGCAFTVGYVRDQWRSEGEHACQQQTNEGTSVACDKAADPLATDFPYVKSYLENLWALTISPLRMGRDDMAWSALTLGLTGLSMTQDKRFRLFWQTTIRPQLGDRWSRFFARLGAKEGGYTIGLLYFFAEIFRLRRLGATTLISLQAIILANTFVEALKDTSRRERPKTSPDNPFAFHWPPKIRTNASLAASHPASLAAFVAVFLREYAPMRLTPISLLVRGLGITSIVGMCLARINDDKHWLSDTLLGAAMGYAVGGFCHRLNPFAKRL